MGACSSGCAKAAVLLLVCGSALQSALAVTAETKHEHPRMETGKSVHPILSKANNGRHRFGFGRSLGPSEKAQVRAAKSKAQAARAAAQGDSSIQRLMQRRKELKESKAEAARRRRHEALRAAVEPDTVVPGQVERDPGTSVQQQQQAEQQEVEGDFGTTMEEQQQVAATSVVEQQQVEATSVVGQQQVEGDQGMSVEYQQQRGPDEEATRQGAQEVDDDDHDYYYYDPGTSVQQQQQAEQQEGDFGTTMEEQQQVEATSVVEQQQVEGDQGMSVEYQQQRGQDDEATRQGAQGVDHDDHDNYYYDDNIH